MTASGRRRLAIARRRESRLIDVALRLGPRSTIFVTIDPRDPRKTLDDALVFVGQVAVEEGMASLVGLGRSALKRLFG